MQAMMVVVMEPTGKGSFEIPTGGVAAEAIEFFFIGLMVPFHFAVEARGTRGDEAVLSMEELAHGGKGVDFDGAI